MSGKLSNAQKASKAIRQAKEKAEDLRFKIALDNLLVRQQEERDELAVTYSVKPEFIDRLRSTSSHYKDKRVPSLSNAKIRAKALEVNTGTWLRFLSTHINGRLILLGREIGHRVKRSELQLMVNNDESLQNLTPEQNEALLASVLEHRTIKKTGARLSNQSASLDFRKTISNLSVEVCDLSSTMQMP